MSVVFFSGGQKSGINPNVIPGGGPQIVRFWVVQFKVDGSVCRSCDFLKGLVFGIVCRPILTIVHLLDEPMVDVRWRGALGLYFRKAMYAIVTSVIMQALASSLKKIKAPPPSICYPVYSEGANEYPPLFSIKA
jgi:hypothetical protein